MGTTEDDVSHFFVELVVDLWFLAVIINIIGNTIDGSGWVIEKKAHLRLAHQNAAIANDNDENKHKQTPTYSWVTSKLWWFGFFMHTIGNIIAAISYGLGPQSLLLPLENATPVFIIYLSHRFLDELLRKQDIFATILIVISTGFSVTFGPRGRGEEHTANDFVIAYSNPNFILFMSIISSAILINFIILKYSKFQSSKYEIKQENTELIDAGFIYTHTFYMMSYLLIAAYFGVWNILLTKSAMELFASTTISKEIAIHNWTHWITYLIWSGVIFTAIILEYWRQKALKSYNSVYVGSIYQTMLITFGIIEGGIFFDEFNGMSYVNIIIFVSSIIVSFIGITLLAVHSQLPIFDKLFNCKCCNNINKRILAKEARDRKDLQCAVHIASSEPIDLDTIQNDKQSTQEVVMS